MANTIDWYRKLSVRGKLYSLIVIGILSWLVSRQNEYQYSNALLVLCSFVGIVTFIDLAFYLNRTYNKKAGIWYNTKRVLGLFVISGFSSLAFIVISGIAMDVFNSQSDSIKVKLTSYSFHAVNAKRGVCIYRVHVADSAEKENTFCVSHIKNHYLLKDQVDKKVVFVGRKSWAGFVIDDFRLINLHNNAAQSDAAKLHGTSASPRPLP